MLRHPLAPVVLLLALFAGPASAEPIRYSTRNAITPFVGFEEASGTFEPGSDVSLGRFVLTEPQAGSPITLEGLEFAIELNASDSNRWYANPKYLTGTTVIGSVVIRGHLSGTLQAGMPSFAAATFDSVEFGTSGPIPAAGEFLYEFPIPLADVKLPSPVFLRIPTDTWVDGEPSYSAEITVRITPEPAAWMAWGLVGLGGLVAKRRANRSM